MGTSVQDCFDVLLSHSDTLHLGALPYAMTMKQFGLSAPVYATEPVFRLGLLTTSAASKYQSLICSHWMILILPLPKRDKINLLSELSFIWKRGRYSDCTSCCWSPLGRHLNGTTSKGSRVYRCYIEHSKRQWKCVVACGYCWSNTGAAFDTRTVLGTTSFDLSYLLSHKTSQTQRAQSLEVGFSHDIFVEWATVVLFTERGQFGILQSDPPPKAVKVTLSKRVPLAAYEEEQEKIKKEEALKASLVKEEESNSKAVLGTDVSKSDPMIIDGHAQLDFCLLF
ncbi:unnamed protein product [Lactuca virosa]|uniref:Cleavage and polyadenylation specificity factor subunit 2 n=1 Tax=Lactuca virosa TaxID=75947 RepID=A0AAU9NQT4_9ASTR|nr:unnamed protein product [Lactuca virosa]